MKLWRKRMLGLNLLVESFVNVFIGPTELKNSSRLTKVNANFLCTHKLTSHKLPMTKRVHSIGNSFRTHLKLMSLHLFKATQKNKMMKERLHNAFQ